MSGVAEVFCVTKMLTDGFYSLEKTSKRLNPFFVPVAGLVVTGRMV